MTGAASDGPGDGGPLDTEVWLAALRRRFHEVTRRRVALDAVEDIVQDALRVVVERLQSVREPEDRPSLAWCFQTLRNVIGDHYRRNRRAQGRLTTLDAGATIAAGEPGPIEAVESAELIGIVRGALETMEARDGACARYLRRLGAGSRPAELARDEGVSEAVLYRRVYRCRHKLRALLREKGVDA